MKYKQSELEEINSEEYATWWKIYFSPGGYHGSGELGGAEAGNAAPGIPVHLNSSGSSTNRLEAENEVAAGEDGAAAAAGGGVSAPVQARKWCRGSTMPRR